MNEQYEKLESLANDFEMMSPNNFFLKEKISNVYFTNKFRINYKDYFVAISKNGGLIATCKKKKINDFENKYSRESTNIVMVMQQNGKRQYKIPITLNNKDRWMVAFDFSENENLYGICNDGAIYKFDILLLEAKEQISTNVFQTDNIIKAKFFQKGFIALTNRYKTFYYVKDFKNVVPKSLFHMDSLLDFKDVNLDFVGIPPLNSRSGKFELIFLNEKGDGIVNHPEQPEKCEYRILPIEVNGVSKRTIEHVYELKENELKPYILTDDDNNKNKNTKENAVINTDVKNNEKTVGKIIAIAISPSYEKIALYNNKGNVYIFDSQFKKGRKEAKFEISKDLTKEEQEDIQYIINFGPNCQFLFCGEDAVALFGKKYVLITNEFSKKTLIYKIYEEEKNTFSFIEDIYGKCISEVDGLRISTNNGIYFISKVDKNLYDSCYPFENNLAKKLMKAYNSYLLDELDSGEKIKELGKDLSNTIFLLLNAAKNIYWKDDETDEAKKESQMYLLKVAQLSKFFVEGEKFNFDKFLGICKDLRVVNNLRNNDESQILITFKQYESLEFKDLIKKILIQHNFNLAFKISNYLENYDTKKIYQKWACAKIKKLNKLANKSEQLKLFEEILYSFDKIKNVSYIQLAKKAFKCKHNELGMKFLDKEKSILAKIPIYLKMNKLEKVLELSYETYDSNVIEIALNQLIDYTGVDNDFIEKVKDNKKLRYAVIDFLKKNGDKGDMYIDKYLKEIKDYEELMLLELEKFFTCKEIDMKKKYLKMAKEYHKLLDKNNPNNKFYSTYLTELNNSIKFKKECMDIERKIIPKGYIMPFDNSIYDCYKFGVKENKLDWIEKQNKNFELSSKKMTLMRFRTLAENGKVDLIEDIIKSSSLKKLSITPINMADFYFELKNYDLATKYVKLVTHNEYFDYKIEMLKQMEKYEDVLEVAISSKNLDKIPDIVNDVLKKKPELKNKVDEICKNYKVNLA